MHAPVSGQAHGSAALRAAARRLYISLHVRFSASLHSNSNARVLDCFPRFSDLLDFSFLFQCREIPSCRCVRDVQKFLYFVVGDFFFLAQKLKNLFKLLSLPVLNRGAGFHEQIAGGMRGCCRYWRTGRLWRLRRGSRRNRLNFWRQRLIYWYLSRLRFGRGLRRFRLRGSRSRLRRCRSWFCNRRRSLRCIFVCHARILPQPNGSYSWQQKLAFSVGSGIIIGTKVSPGLQSRLTKSLKSTCSTISKSAFIAAKCLRPQNIFCNSACGNSFFQSLYPNFVSRTK